MKRDEYNKAINNNTISSWGLIALVLIISYIIEIYKGLRTIEYVALFIIITITPIVITYLFNKRYDGKSLAVKYFFVIGYLILYTFVLLTAHTTITFVYIIPMIAILIAYCDNKLSAAMFIYAIFLNMYFIYYQYKDVTLQNSVTTITLNQHITMWEIQMACIILSAIFLYRTCNLIKQRDKILDELNDTVYHDALTKVYNLKYVDDVLKPQFDTSNKGMSIAFIDIDDFKHFNTLYGHKFGDKVIQTICSVIERIIDKYGETYLVRVGGDEFIIVSNDFTLSSFVKLLDKIRKIVSDTKLDYADEKVGINISIGAANKKSDKCETYLDLYNLADNRNGIAKSNGKNYVEYKK